MSPWLLALAVVAALYAGVLIVLAVAGRGDTARAWLRVIGDCVVLVARLVRDPRVPRRHKALLGALALYLALPFDLVPDVIPIAGQADDALLAALVLRRVLHRAGAPLLDEHWPGPPATRRLIDRLVFGASPA